MNKFLLVIEDDDYAFGIIELQLKNIGYPHTGIKRYSKLSALKNVNPDEVEIVLTDLTLPDSACSDTFKRVKKKFPYKPVIVITGSAEIEIAIKSLQQGAQDYLVKGEFNEAILKKSILFAIERNKVYDHVYIERQKLHAIINNTEDIIWLVNTNHKIILGNDSFWKRLKKISGKEKKEIRSSDLDDELVKKWKGFYQKAMNGELTKMIWQELHHGEKTYEEIRFNLIHNKDNNIIGVSCFSRDITKQFAHLKMIKTQNKQLKEIAWVHSHEVRGPITTILGMAQLFNVDANDHEENAEILTNLITATTKLDDVIKKINSYTITSWRGLPIIK